MYSQIKINNYTSRIVTSVFALLIAITSTFVITWQDAYAYDSTRRILQEIEKELLKDRTFTVAYNNDHIPFQYTNDSGKASGTVIELIDTLASQYNFNVVYEEYDERKAQNAEYDIIVATIAKPKDLEKNYQSTISYHDERLMLIFEKGLTLNDVKNKEQKIGTLRYLYNNNNELYKEFPMSQIFFFDSSQKLLSSYDAQEIDIALFSRTLLDAATLGEMTFIREHYSKNHTIIASTIEVPQKFYIANSIANQFLPIFNVMLPGVDYITTLISDAEPHIKQLPFSAPDYLAIGKIILAALAVLVILLSFFIVRKIKAQRNANKNMIDLKTSLMSFEAFSSEIERKLKNISKHEYEITGIDIDLFRLIVAYYGNEVAEKLIQNMAEMLKQYYNEENALITRYNKDYFLIFKKITDDGQKIKTFVEDILTPTFKQTTGNHYAVSFSVGTYIIDDTSISLTDMINFCELARRQGKNIHTHTFYTFDDVMNKQYHDTLNITYRMTSALENKEFILEYQPKIDLKRLKISGAEALVRWTPASGNKIYPNEFIPIFEKNGFISKLDVYVFEEVCRFINENRKLCENIKIACNLSPVTLALPELVGELSRISKKYSVEPSKLELEIVESVIDAMPLAELIQKINEIKEVGFSIALDDFGAGASSLNRFGLLPIDVVKLDKKFIDNIDNERMAHTVKTFIVNSKELKLLTVAEGIETKEQLHWLREVNCDIAQGFLLSKPLSKDDFIYTVAADFLYLQ